MRATNMLMAYVFIAAIAIATVMETLIPIGAQGPPVEDWNLSGNEILFELSSGKGTYVPGIYAWDPKDTDLASIKLLAKGGKRPVWSPHHKKFIYIFNDDLWVADVKGDRAALNPSLPLQLMKSDDPPVRWGWDGSFSLVKRSESWGSKAYVGYSVEDKPVSLIRSQYSPLFENATEAFWPIVPLKKATKTGITNRISDVKWQDVLSTSNLSFSPTGTAIASEVYPASPMDLKRSESRILIYELLKWSGDQDKDSIQIQKTRSWFATDTTIPPIVGPGRRLTSLGEDITELMPLWSPTGEWIALSAMDYARGYMIPAVVKADGKGPTILMLSQDSPQDDVSPQSHWKPIANTVSAKNSNTFVTNTEDWGALNRTAKKWSVDGKYLWMQQGQRSISVAKFENGKWLEFQVAESTGSEFGIHLSAFNGSHVAWIEDSGDRRKIKSLNIIDAETKKTISINFPPATIISWMDW